jgi:hypothetical protein
MASETSELTFVRCPSCRSLVPESAARCRICNNQLEGAGNAAATDANRPGSRVRQKTISASADELVEAFAGDDAPPVAAPVNDRGAPPVAGGGVDEEADPLAAFLQEFDDEPELSVGGAPSSKDTPAVVANDDHDEDDLDAFLDDFELDFF